MFPRFYIMSFCFTSLFINLTNELEVFVGIADVKLLCTNLKKDQSKEHQYFVFICQENSTYCIVKIKLL